MSWGKHWENRIVGEVKAKLDRTLKDRVGDKIDWDTATWCDLKVALDELVLISHPKVKRRYQMLTCSQSTKESVRAFIARVQKLSAVAYIEDGLSRDQIIVRISPGWDGLSQVVKL